MKYRPWGWDLLALRVQKCANCIKTNFFVKVQPKHPVLQYYFKKNSNKFWKTAS